MDSAYIIQIQIDNTEEVTQIYASNKDDMTRVIEACINSDNLVLSVQSLGVVETANDYLLSLVDNNPDLNFGSDEGDN